MIFTSIALLEGEYIDIKKLLLQSHFTKRNESWITFDFIFYFYELDLDFDPPLVTPATPKTANPLQGVKN